MKHQHSASTLRRSATTPGFIPHNREGRREAIRADDESEGLAAPQQSSRALSLILAFFVLVFLVCAYLVVYTSQQRQQQIKKATELVIKAPKLPHEK